MSGYLFACFVLCVLADVHIGPAVAGGGGGELQVAVLATAPPLWWKLLSEGMNLSFGLLYF